MIKKLLLTTLVVIIMAFNLSVNAINFVNKTRQELVMWQPNDLETFNPDKFDEKEGVRYKLLSEKSLQLNPAVPLLN